MHPPPSPTGWTNALARPIWDINHVLAYGQSLSSGWEGWPALSVAPVGGSLMLGDSVRPRHEQAPDWIPSGAARFAPLVATVQDVGTGALLSPDAVARLPASSVALGETVLEAAVNDFRRRQAADPMAVLHRLLASSCGVGGRTLEQLSRGANPELFNRLRACVRAARQAATAAGASYGIVALLLLQGENNNWRLNGGTGDRAEYKALMARFVDDFAADVVGGIAAQDTPPAVFTYQTGGAYADDAMAVPQAQLEVALERPDVFLAAPVYPVTDKGGHLDANGYRWLGAQFGKVMHCVLTLGQDWRPLYPLSARLDGPVVVVEFHVPTPPLAWGRPFRGHRRCDLADKGFTVLDGEGVVKLARVELAGPTTVALILQRRPAGRALLRYGDQSRHGGRGSLHDSDPTVAFDPYVFDATTGHRLSASQPDLNGLPYPLMNWCVAFALPITPGG
jgi:hypothetical protein